MSAHTEQSAPHLKYGSKAWSNIAMTNQQVLDKVQNQALRIITGSIRSTPIKAMETTAAVQPQSDERYPNHGPGRETQKPAKSSHERMDE